MATDLFLEMAELPATGSLGTGQLDTRDLLVAGVPISISSKYLYLYLELSGSTIVQEIGNIIIVENAHVLPISSGKRKWLFSNVTRELSCEIHHYRFEVIVNNKPLF